MVLMLVTVCAYGTGCAVQFQANFGKVPNNLTQKLKSSMDIIITFSRVVADVLDV